MCTRLTYKIEVLYNKYSPFLIALLIFLSNVLDAVGIHTSSEGYLFVPSLLTSFHMYVSCRNFKFCRFHKTFVHYCVFNNIVFIYRENWGVWQSGENLIFDIVVALIFGAAAVYCYRSEKHKVRC